MGGALLGWIPIVSLVGGILTLVGVILVILGRKAFGKAHARNIVVSIVLFAVGIVVIIILAVGFAFAIVSVPGGGTPTPGAVLAAFNALLWGTFLVAAVTGVASVLFTYALQKTPGKILLWAGYAASVVIKFAIIFLVGPLISEAVSQSFQGGQYDPAPILAASSRIDVWAVLHVVPSMMFAAANYLAWTRIKRGEIPEPAKPAAPMPPPAA